jgi:acyl dehydratase
MDHAPVIEFSIDLSADHAARWFFARDGVWPRSMRIGEPLPMSWAVFLRLQPILGVRIHDLLERDPHRGLYGGVTYRASRPISIGQKLDARAIVTDRREMDSPRGRLKVTTLTTTYREKGETVLEEAVQMIDLPTPPTMSANSATPASAASPASPVSPTSSPQASPTTPDAPIAVLDQGFDRTRIAWMTAATGDTNPLHLDRLYAQGRGFADVVVPAPLITAWVERAISDRHEGSALTLLELRYQGATLPDQPLSLYQNPSAGPGRIELRSGDQIRARGRFALT